MMRRYPYPGTEQFKAEAARRMCEHQYTQLVKADEVEAWRCKRPDSGCYWFDIIVTRARIVVTGDIEGLLFTVGSSYGIPWLSHQSKGYVAEKLEQQCRHKEFDQPYFLDAVARLAADAVDRILPEYERNDFGELPAWIGSSHDKSCTFEAVRAWVDTACKNEGTFNAQHRQELEELAGEIEQAADIENTHEAYTFLNDSGPLACDCPSDFNLERLDEEMVQRLYMVDHAARAILAIKSAAQPQGEAAHA